MQNNLQKYFSNKLLFLISRKINNWKNEVKWAWQRVFRGYDDTAIWGLDSYLSEILPKILKELSEVSYGRPNCFKTDKQWKSVLRKMAEGFECAQKIIGGEALKKIKLTKPRKNFLGEIVYYDYKFDKKLYRSWLKKFEKGMKLFNKYFFDLWS